MYLLLGRKKNTEGRSTPTVVVELPSLATWLKFEPNLSAVCAEAQFTTKVAAKRRRIGDLMKNIYKGNAPI